MGSLIGARVCRSSPAYTSEVDTVDAATWYKILDRFEDANIYQTWAYDEVRCGRDGVSHLLLKRNGEVVAAAQARIATIPIIRAGIAYIRWGPLWRLRDERANPELFRQAIRALRNEYACRRGLVLRLCPAVFDADHAEVPSILTQEGFLLCKEEKPSRTLILDVSLPLEDLRKGLRQHWRRYLKVAENSGLEIIESTSDDTFETLVKIYKEMVSRKGFPEPNDINEFRRIQQQLPDKFKMKLMLCKDSGEICAGLICSIIGNTAVYLFGATSNAGLKARGAYLLHWKLIEWLKRNGVTYYDLNGIDPVANPGTYKFKSDLCGNNGRDVCFLGRFDSVTNMLSYACVACGDSLRAFYRARKQKAIRRSDVASVMHGNADEGEGRSRGVKEA